jgi:hypothetical protein
VDKIKSPLNRLIVSAVLSALLAVQFVGTLRPVTILPFVVLAQLVLFIRFIGYDLNLLFYVAGNVAVVCAALLPMTIRKPIKAHWVR